MSITAVGKFAAIGLLAAALTGCIDARVAVEVTSQTTARATLTQVMGSEFYAMMTLRAKAADPEGALQDVFCRDGALNELEDGSASCVVVTEGPFAALTLGAGQDMPITFTPAGNGLVRVALPTAELTRQTGRTATLDDETRQMIEALLVGRKLTLTVSGSAVTETNMTLSEDETAAEQVIPLLDLVRGKLELPTQYYAVVQAP